MTHKLHLVPRDLVRVLPNTKLGYEIDALVVEVDSHPFEYDQVLIQVLNVPVDSPNVWISEKHLTRLNNKVDSVR